MSHNKRHARERREPSPAVGIPVEICKGPAESACLGKEWYPSAATAQNGAYAWALARRHGKEPEPLDPLMVVYDCFHCDGWHAGRRHAGAAA